MTRIPFPVWSCSNSHWDILFSVSSLILFPLSPAPVSTLSDIIILSVDLQWQNLVCCTECTALDHWLPARNVSLFDRNESSSATSRHLLSIADSKPVNYALRLDTSKKFNYTGPELRSWHYFTAGVRFYRREKPGSAEFTRRRFTHTKCSVAARCVWISHSCAVRPFWTECCLVAGVELLPHSNLFCFSSCCPASCGSWNLLSSQCHLTHLHHEQGTGHTSHINIVVRYFHYYQW